MGESVKLGDEAPDFVLKDQEGNEFRLSELRGKRVLLSFHPLAWTGVCAKQMQSLEQNYERFSELNAVPVGISVDSAPTKQAWARDLKIEKTRLLADFWPHGQVAGMYGVFREHDGFSERANIIIDEEGTVVFTKVYPIAELPDIEELMDFLKE